MVKKEFYFLSTNHKNLLHCIMWKPDKPIKAILQISHGMTEHLEKYNDFASYMAENGVLVVGNDHLGHGKSVTDKKDLGFFDAKNPSATLVNDLFKLTKNIKNKFPKVPYFLLGHSMGSFIARRYIMTYGKYLDGALILGTGNQPKFELNFGRLLVNIGIKIFGAHYTAKIIDKITFFTYNKKFKDIKTGSEWLTKDNVFIAKFADDPTCHFTFTLNGFNTLFSTINYIEKRENIKKIPKELPIILLSGKDDPVGNYGKAVKKVYRIYKRAKIKDISIKLYDDDRHEILNELNKYDVYNDILEWLKRIAKF